MGVGFSLRVMVAISLLELAPQASRQAGIAPPGILVGVASVVVLIW